MTHDDDPNGETVIVPMGCASEGAVDVYIEPHLPPRTMLVIGHTPVAQALTRLAQSLDGYHVLRVVSQDEIGDLPHEDAASAIALASLPAFLAALSAVQYERLTAVVASQGQYDERAIAALLSSEEPPAFVGLLASRKRAASVLGSVAQDGVPSERLTHVRNPVGLDIGARSPSEVAVSILAEIVAACVPTAPIDHDCGHCCET
jgi:xanthine dehydrogenase accessory factor